MARTRPSLRTIFDNHSNLPTMQDDADDDGQLTPLCHPANSQVEASGSFFSRFKQTFSSSPLGNILGQTNSSNGFTPTRSYSLHASKNNNANTNMNHELQTPPDVSPSPTPRRIASSQHVFIPTPPRASSHYRTCTSSSIQSDASSSPSVAPSSCFSPMSTSSHPTLATSTHGSDYNYDDKWSPVLTSPSEMQDTPPLTPDTNFFDTTTAQGQDSGSENVYNRTRTQRSASITIRDDENTSTSSEGNKGKAPAPPFPYETLLADITNPTSSNDEDNQDMVANDDTGEWWGLQYTLELSRRDSRASDTSSSTTGEHSKSRESWAAIHQGTISPLYEDTNFQDWKRWHRGLEKAELRRRRKRTIDFFEESMHLSSLYVDENLAQRAVYLYTELLTPGEMYDALLWVEYAAERRPDPYQPQEKHNLSWILKKHRSIACLRELKASSLDD